MAYIYLDKNGDIQVEGHRIILGRGEDEKEPYLRYTYYKEHINELKKQIKALADEVKRITDSYNLAFTSATAVPYSTIAQLVAVATSERPTIQVNIENIKQNVDRINVEAIASKKVFGQ